MLLWFPLTQKFLECFGGLLSFCLASSVQMLRLGVRVHCWKVFPHVQKGFWLSLCALHVWMRYSAKCCIASLTGDSCSKQTHGPCILRHWCSFNASSWPELQQPLSAVTVNFISWVPYSVLWALFCCPTHNQKRWNINASHHFVAVLILMRCELCG